MNTLKKKKKDFPDGSMVKNLPANVTEHKMGSEYVTLKFSCPESKHKLHSISSLQNKIIQENYYIETKGIKINSLHSVLELKNCV